MIPPSAELLDSIVCGLQALDAVCDPNTAMESIQIVRDSHRIAGALVGATEELTVTATLAEACARAAARGNHHDAGR